MVEIQHANGVEVLYTCEEGQIYESIGDSEGDIFSSRPCTTVPVIQAMYRATGVLFAPREVRRVFFGDYDVSVVITDDEVSIRKG